MTPFITAEKSAVSTTTKLWSEIFGQPNYSAHQINLQERNKKMRKTIIIFAPSKARQLLKAGFQIIDIKPHHDDPTKKQSVFVFKYDERINDFI